MKNLIKKNTAMTLTELIVASILVVIVITGALSADFAIRTWHKRIEQRTLIQLDLARAMEQILQDGMLTIGEGVCEIDAGDPNCTTDADDTHWSNNSALAYWNLDDERFICFKNDPDITTADDEIFRYYLIDDKGDGSYTLSHRELTINNGALTTLDKNFIILTSNIFFTVEKDPSNGRITSINIYLETRPDPSEAEDPLKNPTYSLETSFMPAGLTQ